MEIKEIVVVEGRDDTAAIKRAVVCTTIETHGYGIRPETWALLDQGYRGPGLILFTDPDHAGQQLRNRLLSRYPKAKQAFLDLEDALREADIGVENGSPEKIREALEKALGFQNIPEVCQKVFTFDMLFQEGLTSSPKAALRRRKMGKILGIGYGNSIGFLEKLNGFGIRKEDFYEALRTIQYQEDSTRK